jgi:23S rRNA pseudouridine1911/1915/1917 synthase
LSDLDLDLDDEPGLGDDLDPVPSAAPAWLDARGQPVDMGLRSHLHADGTPRIVERHFHVVEEHAGARLDHYLKRMIPRLSRTRVQAIIREQLHKTAPVAQPPPLKASSIVAAGDRYVIRRAARPEPPCPRHIEILHEDDQVLVVDKPPGLPCHASAKFYFNTLTRVLLERYGAEPQICHRLDRETSGALVVAKDATTAALVKGAFEHKRVAKTYLAIVHGCAPWDAEASLDFPLALAQPGDPTKLPGVRMLVRTDGLPSTTRVRVLARAGAYTLVRCAPITGRQHQIRAHLAAAGFPIVGDKLYAHGDDAFMAYCDRGLTPELAARFELARHALHAHSVTFPHPSRPAPLTVESPLARDLDEFLRARSRT